MTSVYLYFLIKNNAIVYIGISSNLSRRLDQHNKNKSFDSIRYMEARSLVDAKKHEKRLIRKFKPILNIQCTRELKSLSSDGILIKIPKELKIAVNQYVSDRKIKGGVSGLIKRFLQKKVKV